MIKVSIGGSENIDLNEKVVTGVEFSIITPDDSNARATNQFIQLVVTGKIIPSVSSADGEPTVALDKWAAVPDGVADAYRSVTATVIESGVTIREYKLPNAFVVNLEIDYSDDQGIGTFTLTVRQKKDKSSAVTVNGGYAS